MGSRNRVKFPEAFTTLVVWIGGSFYRCKPYFFCIFGWQKTSYWCQLHQEIVTNFLAANAIDAANKLALRSSETKVAGMAATPLFCSTVRSSSHLKIPKFEGTFKNPQSLGWSPFQPLSERVAFSPSQKGHDFFITWKLWPLLKERICSKIPWFIGLL